MRTIVNLSLAAAAIFAITISAIAVQTQYQSEPRPTPSLPAFFPSPREVSPSRVGIAGVFGAAGYVVSLPEFSTGDEPYDVQVCSFENGRTNCLILTVTSHCECPLGHVADIADAAFYVLAPLDKSKILVQIDGVRP